MSKSKSKIFLELAKPSITRLVLITTVIGYFLAKQSLADFDVLIFTLIGTALTCGGSAALNNYLERDFDAKMVRTACRALPKGSIRPADALGFGLTLVILGTIILVSFVNLLTGFLALLTAFLYVLIYTPLKRVTWLNTFIGAIPGALPPLGGWAAATGQLGLGGWILFAIMFVWQMPHFYSIAWMYKDDYENAGYKMITLGDDSGKKTFRQIIIFTIILIPVSLTPIFLPKVGFFYIISAGILGSGFLAYTIAGYFNRTLKTAKSLLRTSIVYLPLLFISLLLDTLI